MLREGSSATAPATHHVGANQAAGRSGALLIGPTERDWGGGSQGEGTQKTVSEFPALHVSSIDAVVLLLRGIS